MTFKPNLLHAQHAEKTYRESQGAKKKKKIKYTMSIILMYLYQMVLYLFIYFKSSLIPKDSNESHVIGVLKTEPQRVKQIYIQQMFIDS